MMTVVVVLACVSGTQADAFGSGGSQFAIDFVPISGDASSPGFPKCIGDSRRRSPLSV